MDGLLIFFLIVIALYYLGKWYIRRKIRKFFGQFNQQTGGTKHKQAHTNTERSKKDDSAGTTDKKKVFTADEGEYVEFEEIKD